MHVEVEPKMVHVRFYPDERDDYIAGFFLYKEGDDGIINGLLTSQPGFFASYGHLIPHAMRQIGVKRVHAHMTAPTARLMKRWMAPHLDVTLGEVEPINGRKFRKITAALGE